MILFCGWKKGVGQIGRAVLFNIYLYWIGVGIGMVGVTIFPAAAAAQEAIIEISPEKTAYLGKGAFQPGPYNAVYDASAGPDGNLYLTYYHRRKVLILNPDLEIIGEIASVPGAHGLTFDKSGHLYVATHWNGRVYKYHPGSHEEIPAWDQALRDKGLIKEPVSVATDEDNNVYIADIHLKTIVKTDEDGGYLMTFHLPAAVTPPDFIPHGISRDGDYIYVADRRAGSVLIFSLDGVYHARWKPPINFDPLTVRKIAAKRFCVPNAADGTVAVFNSEGRLLGRWGGAAPGEFRTPTNVLHDGRGRIIVVEQDANRIQRFDAGGLELLGQD